MTSSSDNRYNVEYRYGHDGERALKYSLATGGTNPAETLYFNKMWSWKYSGSDTSRDGQNSKHIYLGDTRIMTKIGKVDGSMDEESVKQYYYHSDHLGSAQLITNYEGDEYERIEYTPYGELWVEKASTASNIDIPYRFTGKELDSETGLYYYGARYQDPKTSRWLSTDPALGEYIPGAPVNDQARKRNGNLPGMGGVFNTVNLHLYHYAGNNPVKYTDPDGREQSHFQKMITGAVSAAIKSDASIKNDISIVITRSVDDNGQNGKYFMSNLSVQYRGTSLNSSPVQSTADNVRTDADFTLSGGTYSGTLLEQSGSYSDAILVFGDDFLIHPDQITTPEMQEQRSARGLGNGPFSRPFSAGCQILELGEFNELINILDSLGFEKGDTIDVQIRDVTDWKPNQSNEAAE